MHLQLDYLTEIRYFYNLKKQDAAFFTENPLFLYTRAKFQSPNSRPRLPTTYQSMNSYPKHNKFFKLPIKIQKYNVGKKHGQSDQKNPKKKINN
jgi:hypothetical protein